MFDVDIAIEAVVVVGAVAVAVAVAVMSGMCITCGEQVVNEFNGFLQCAKTTGIDPSFDATRDSEVPVFDKQHHMIAVVFLLEAWSSVRCHA